MFETTNQYKYIYIHIHDIYMHMYALRELVMMRTIPAWQTAKAHNLSWFRPKKYACNDSLKLLICWIHICLRLLGHQSPISASIKEVQLPFVEPCQFHWDRNGWCHFKGSSTRVSDTVAWEANPGTMEASGYIPYLKKRLNMSCYPMLSHVIPSLPSTLRWSVPDGSREWCCQS